LDFIGVPPCLNADFGSLAEGLAEGNPSRIAGFAPFRRAEAKLDAQIAACGRPPIGAT
jgi:hypothetical protein